MSSKSETAKVAAQVNVFLKDTNQPLDQLSLVSFVEVSIQSNSFWYKWTTNIDQRWPTDQNHKMSAMHAVEKVGKCGIGI